VTSADEENSVSSPHPCKFSFSPQGPGEDHAGPFCFRRALAVSALRTCVPPNFKEIMRASRSLQLPPLSKTFLLETISSNYNFPLQNHRKLWLRFSSDSAFVELDNSDRFRDGGAGSLDGLCALSRRAPTLLYEFPLKPLARWESIGGTIIPIGLCFPLSDSGRDARPRNLLRQGDLLALPCGQPWLRQSTFSFRAHVCSGAQCAAWSIDIRYHSDVPEFPSCGRRSMSSSSRTLS